MDSQPLVSKTAVMIVIILFQSFFLVLVMFDFESSTYDQNDSQPPFKTGEQQTPLKTSKQQPPFKNNEQNTPLKTSEQQVPANKETINPPGLEHLLSNIAKKLRKAAIHVKSMKTRQSLMSANNDLVNLYTLLNLNYSEVQTINITKAISVCPEILATNPERGASHQDKRWVTAKCNYAKKLTELITIVYVAQKESDVSQFLSSKNKSNLSHLKTIICANFPVDAKVKSTNEVEILENINGPQGMLWNEVVSKVKTEYTFIAKDVSDLDNNANLERYARNLNSFELGHNLCQINILIS